MGVSVVCDFCGKCCNNATFNEPGKHEAMYFRGQQHIICHDCVYLCMRIIKDELTDESKVAAAKLVEKIYIKKENL